VDDTLKTKENLLHAMQNEIDQMKQNLESKQSELDLKKETHLKELTNLQNKLRESDEQRKETLQKCTELNKDVIYKDSNIRELQSTLHKQEEKIFILYKAMRIL